MSSIKKTTSVIITAIIVAGIAFSLTEQFDSDNSVILDQIEFDAVYLKSENFIKISFDDKSPFVTSVIRIGTAAITTRGLIDSEMKFIVDLIDKVIKFPNDNEGSLDKKLASLVNKKKCLEIAKYINLQKFIFVGNSKKKKIDTRSSLI